MTGRRRESGMRWLIEDIKSLMRVWKYRWEILKLEEEEGKEPKTLEIYDFEDVTIRDRIGLWMRKRRSARLQRRMVKKLLTRQKSDKSEKKKDDVK